MIFTPDILPENNEYYELRMLLHTLINGSSFRRDNGMPDVKGEHDELIEHIIEDGKLVCENKDDVTKVIYDLNRSTLKYALSLGDKVKLSWFDGINSKHLSIPEYEKLLRFLDTMEYNNEYNNLFKDKNDIIWKYSHYIYVNHEKLIELQFDWQHNNSEDRPAEGCIGITEEEFNKNYKSMQKEYE